ncbi:5-hydroxytryptamine receptor 4 [Aplysia californica]|uniref:5-hydroxytryptamine receptor 4 n=1 Tax=Aplysia californica TaxID=6500 RepID=A0ABM0JN16_APLCA|nr:5-hydroxytryptamine receptor 4 [Aplysia californica]
MNNTSCHVFGVDPRSERHLITYNQDVLIVISAFLSLIAAFTVVSNMVVIIALVRPRHQERTITTYLVSSMAFSDAVLGAFILPLGIYEILNNGRWDIGREMCDIRVTTDVVLSTVSIFHVTNMAIERYLAVCKPWVYRTLSMKTTYLMLGMSWLVPLSIVALPVLCNWHTMGIEALASCLELGDGISMCVLMVNVPFQLAMASMSFYGPLIIIIIIYSLIFIEARRSEKYHSSSSVTLSGTHTHNTDIDNQQKEALGISRENSSGLSVLEGPEGRLKRHNYEYKETKLKKSKHRGKNVKTAKAIGRLILCFAICWMPFSIWSVVTPFVSYSMPLALHLCVTWMGYINSAINPVLYCSQKTIKSAIWNLLCPKVELERRRKQTRFDYVHQLTSGT